MKTLPLNVSIVASVLAVTSLQAAPRLETCLPASTTIIASISNYTSFEEELKSGDLSGLIENESLRAAIQPFIDNMEKQESEQDIITFEELEKHFGGQIVLGIDLSPIVASDDEIAAPAICLLAGVKDADELEDLVQSRAKDALEADDASARMCEDEKFMGEVIHAVQTTDGEVLEEEPDMFFYSFVKDTVVASNSSEAIRSMIEALKGRAETPFGESLAWEALSERVESKDIYIWADLDSAASVVETAITKAMAEQAAGDPTAPTPDAIISALGLHSFKAFLVTAEVDPDFIHTYARIDVDTSYGLGRLLGGIGGDFPKPAFVPANVCTVQSSSFNAGTMLKEIRQIVFNAVPVTGMYYNMFAAQVTQQGIDLENDLFNNIDGGLVAMNLDNLDPATKDASPINFAYAIKVKNGASIQRALEALFMTTQIPNLVAHRDYAGTDMMIVNNVQNGQPAAALAVKDGWLVISNSVKVLQDIINSGKGDNFWSGDTFENFADGKLKANGYGIAYNDVGTVVRMILKAVAQVHNQNLVMNSVESGEAPKRYDMTLIDGIKLPFGLFGCGRVVPGGIESESYIIRKSE